jgi:hypothetical protein
MLRSYSDVIAEPSFIVKECYYDKDALVSIVTNVFGKKSIDIESLKVCETGILHKNSVEGYKPEGFFNLGVDSLLKQLYLLNHTHQFHNQNFSFLFEQFVSIL